MPQDLYMELYQDTQMFVSFIGYLIARGVGRGTTGKHISTGKKVLDWLETKNPWPHTALLQEWYARLDQQLGYVQPPVEPQALPSATSVWEWVGKLIQYVNNKVDHDVSRWVRCWFLQA